MPTFFPCKVARIAGYAQPLCRRRNIEAVALCEDYVRERRLEHSAYDWKQLFGSGKLAREIEEQAPDLDTVSWRLAAAIDWRHASGINRSQKCGVEPETCNCLSAAIAAGQQSLSNLQALPRTVWAQF